MLPSWITLIAEDERDSFDQYQIPNNITHIHEISIKNDSTLVISFVHTNPLSQDLCLRAWFSKEPNGDSIAPPPLNVFCFLKSPQDARLDPSILPPGKYYFNIQNLVNSSTTYQVAFRDESLT